ncbi:hypothetical protein MPH_13289 [Macrophomina phaseolina MS6]|uniref:Uncharacterized protein n=1 Tax=Macrophomina phaseolina (strain MS6) TaxID=1126212 RepID=K2RYY9_MACPH|nr:hypothetical protein MPH_13289 [Macrophomina phaseolina MS6]
MPGEPPSHLSVIMHKLDIMSTAVGAENRALRRNLVVFHCLNGLYQRLCTPIRRLIIYEPSRLPTKRISLVLADAGLQAGRGVNNFYVEYAAHTPQLCTLRLRNG